jgi:tripartite ATP-independent transporter DctM subunit
MSGETRRDAPGPVQPAPAGDGWRRWLREVETLLVSLALAALVLLPLGEIVLRKVFQTGISGATAFQQHLTLLIGLLGGALAARERRLLTLSTLLDFLKGQGQVFARVFSSAFAAGISVFLCVAAAQLVQTEKEAGKILAYGIPLWTIQSVMPLSFGVIALRLLWHAAESWRGRLVALLLAGGVVWIGLQPPIAPDALVLPALLTLLVAVVLGAPIFVLLGGAALILFWGQDLPIASISLTHYSMVTNPTLPTVPLFTLAGYFLAEGGASKRLIRVFQALFGQFRGGPAIVTVLACAFFTSFTGASGVTILALGGLLMPVLMGAGYSERSTLGLLTGFGGLGLLFPPSLPLILYAIVASLNKAGGVTIEKMFLGGLGPGLLLVAMAAGLGIRLGPKETAGRPAFDRGEAGRAIWAAKWELLLPVVALVALFGGLATPVEAAAVTALYAFVAETFVYHDFKRAREIPRVMADCGLLVGGVLLILGVALGFSNYLIDAQIPTRAAEWVIGAVKSKYAFLLAVNLCLLVVGCVMDVYSAIVVVVPLIVPLGLAYGIDPIHLGIIFLANMELGLLDRKSVV